MPNRIHLNVPNYVRLGVPKGASLGQTKPPNPAGLAVFLVVRLLELRLENDDRFLGRTMMSES